MSSLAAETKAIKNVIDHFGQVDVLVATLTLLDAGKPYPIAPLRLVIKGKARKEFTGDIVNYSNGMNVCISGKIELYKGKT